MGTDRNVYLQEDSEHAWRIDELGQSEQLIDDVTRTLPHLQLTQILVTFVEFSIQTIDNVCEYGTIQ